MYFNYTYPLDIYHDEYQITLDTIDTEGIRYFFEHESINVVAYDMYLELTSTDFDSKLLFANNQLTSVELFIQNTGSIYTDVEIGLTILTQLPSEWDAPVVEISDINLRGGENSTAIIEVQTPDDVYSPTYSMPNLVFQLKAEFEDFTGEVIEFFNVNYSLESELVPEESMVNISAFRTNYSTDLIKNNYHEVDPDIDVIEYSLISFNEQSKNFYFDLENYGFSRTTLEFEVTTLNDFEIEVYSSDNEERELDFVNGYDNVRNIEPLESISFKCKINLTLGSQATKDPIIISVKNLNSGESFSLSMIFKPVFFNEIVFPSLNLDTIEYLENVSLLQNCSVEFFLIPLWNPYFRASYFQNNWSLEILVTDWESNVVSGISFGLVEENTAMTSPYEFSITENKFLIMTINIDESILIGNYSISIIIEQIDDGVLEQQSFETQIPFIVLENSSLTQPNQNNSNNNSTTNNSNNNSTNNSTTDNSTTNNSDGSSNSTINDTSNSTGNNNQGSTNATTDGSQQNGDGNSEVPSDDSDDTAKSQNPDTKAWFFISFVLILITIISVIAIRRNISPRKESVEEAQNKTVAEINPSSTPAASTEEASSSDLTVLHQWTDNNGYTWKQMSDRSMLWWNGKEWVPVNNN
jgi:hypothetical protein